MEPTYGDYVTINSRRAGGGYRVAGSVNLTSLTPSQRAKLTRWLGDQRREGEPYPLITSHVIDNLQALPDLSILERRDRALEFLASHSNNLAEKVRFAGIVDEKLTAALEGLAIATGSRDENEARAYLTFLEESGLVKRTNEYVTITFNGWQYLEKQRAEQVMSVQAFVAMWFDPSMVDPYESGIAPAIRDTGYSVMRIDKKEHINKIDDEIIAEIRRSRFVVADFTSEKDKPRGGVYFEAGFAQGLNKPVIWTCRTDMIGSVHFDTRQFNHITWDTPEDLYTKLKNRIGAVLGQGPLSVNIDAK
jgi:nucleoside 2-deoxyribosyltransferase